jgi:hypothetical protein
MGGRGRGNVSRPRRNFEERGRTIPEPRLVPLAREVRGYHSARSTISEWNRPPMSLKLPRVLLWRPKVREPAGDAML